MTGASHLPSDAVRGAAWLMGDDGAGWWGCPNRPVAGQGEGAGQRTGPWAAHDWLHAGQALHHESDGSSEALSLWMEWVPDSQKSTGDRVLRSKWDGFGRYGAHRSRLHGSSTAAWPGCGALRKPRPTGRSNVAEGG